MINVIEEGLGVSINKEKLIEDLETIIDSSNDIVRYYNSRQIENMSVDEINNYLYNKIQVNALQIIEHHVKDGYYDN